MISDGAVDMSSTLEERPFEASPSETLAKQDQAEARRTLLKRLGRFAGVTAPSVTLLLAAAAKPDRAQAAS